MIKLLKLLILSFLFVLLVIAIKNISQFTYYTQRWVKFSFCDQPIKYKLGNIDSNFGLSRSQVEANALQAAEMWNTLAGKSLFVKSDEGSLAINLVYDERQQYLSQIEKQKLTLEKEKDVQSDKINSLELKKIEIENNVNTLNKEIDYWNSKGGAPKDIYESLINRQKDLNKDIEDINQEVIKINQEADRINREIEGLNEDVFKFNRLIGTKPEEGMYFGSESKIDIYIYENEKNFVNTLAHELGHALGLDHTQNEGSLMYPTSLPTAKITEEDKNMLQEYCKEQNRIELVKNDIKDLIRVILVNLQSELVNKKYNF